MGEEVGGIVALVTSVLAFLGFFVGRWNDTNPKNKWYIRVFKVIDLSQIFDNTRNLGD